MRLTGKQIVICLGISLWLAFFTGTPPVSDIPFMIGKIVGSFVLVMLPVMIYNSFATRSAKRQATYGPGSGDVRASEAFLVVNGQQVSPDALKAAAEPAKRRIRNRGWFRIMLRYPILAYIVLVGGAGAILSAAWKPLDRYFPKLNDFIHSNVTDKNDVDYQIFKLRESKEAYIKQITACDNPKVSFENCRAAILGAEPALNELDLRVTKLASAWQTELSRKEMPDSCKRIGSERYTAWSGYLTAEHRIMALLKEVSPKSPESVRAFGEQSKPVIASEDAAIQRLNNLPPWPKECAGY